MVPYLRIGDINIESYRLMAGLGILICFLVGQIITVRNHFKIARTLILGLAAALGAGIGARTLNFLERYLKDPFLAKIKGLTFMNAGFSVWGGILGGLLAVWFASRLLKIDLNAYMEKLIFLCPLLHFFWKTGCLMNGCCFGKVYSGPFAVHNHAVSDTVSLYPVQLLEMMTLIAISLLLFCLGRVRGGMMKNPAAIYLLLYSTARFFTDFYRYNQGISIGGLTLSQLISVVVFAGCLIFFIYNRTRDGVF